MAYRGMVEPGPQSFRYHFLPSDHSTLYRKFSRANGIDPTRLPQYNVDDWLNPESEGFIQEVRDGVFHYCPRSDDNDRFEIGIATLEMDEAAWKYGHTSQVILDGTFGVCSERLLLFIVMVVDESWKGVPVSFLLFSAATGAKATHASYSRAILQKLLGAWRNHLGLRDGKNFEPSVAITDTDTKERSALLDVWPSIWLLLCKFHVRQCWTNNRKSALRELKGAPFWTDHVRGCLSQLEEKLVQIVTSGILCTTYWIISLIQSVLHADAIKLIDQLQTDFQSISGIPEAKRASSAGLKHISYLMQHWMPIPLWSGWSQFGRSHASRLLGVELEGVLPTTNHLESFNAVLKRVHLPRWLRSGHRLRFDSFIHILIKQILPDIYSTRRARQNYDKWLRERFSHLPGGATLAAIGTELPGKLPQDANRVEAGSPPLCYWAEDVKRDVDGNALLHTGRLSQPQYGLSPEIFVSTCASSSAVLADPNHQCYVVYLHRLGPSSCTCPSFQGEGGACKHMRALRVIVDNWVAAGSVSPMYYPSDRHDALNVRAYLSSIPNAYWPRGAPQNTMSTFNEAPTVPPPSSAAALDTLVSLESAIDKAPAPPEESMSTTSSDLDSEENCSPKSQPSNPHVQALHIQVQSRIEHFARAILPELHGINNMLGEAALVPTPGLVEFLQTIGQVTEKLSKALTLQPSLVDTITMPSGSSQLPIRSAPRTVLDVAGPSKRLRAPSPERRQVRKQSHAPL